MHTDIQPERPSAQQRWIQIREAAGFVSDRAVERAANLTAGTLWTWTTPGRAQRDPNIRSLRNLKRVLNITLDQLDEILVAWREELAEQERAKAVNR